MLTRLLATAALVAPLAVAFVAPGIAPVAFAAGNSTRDLSLSHGISCAKGVEDMEKEVKVAPVRGRQQQEALQGIEAARLACQAGDPLAAEQALLGVRQLLASG